jgi:hypothetical protein
LENRIYIYKFTDLQLIEAIDTCTNPLGLCAVSYDEGRCILACPDKAKGKVKIINFESQQQLVAPAHENQIQAMAIDFSGRVLATASEKGTLIRIFQTEDA